MKTQHVPLGILIREDRTMCGGEYYGITGRIVTVADRKIRNGTGRDAVNGFARIEDLAVSVSGQNARRQDGLYGFTLRYEQPYAVDLDAAEAMAKTLRRLNTRLTRMYNARGSATTFAEYVGRVAEALGDDTVIIQTVRTGSLYSDGEYRFFEIGDGVAYVHGLERAWRLEQQ